LTNYNIRSSAAEGEWRVALSEAESAHFSNLVLPLLLKTKDLEALNLVLRQDQFFLRGQDIYSFTVLAKRENWLAGLKAFLSSSTVAFFFTALPFGQQYEVVARLEEHALQITDLKQRKSYVTAIVEETLTKKPYAKHLALLLLEQGNEGGVDQLRLAREVFKQLTSEDFYHLAIHEAQKMSQYEVRYPNVESGNDLQNELSRLILRYANEGRQ
jgi:hypothetical protein